MSQQFLRKGPKQTALNFTERRGIMRYAMHHSQRLKVKSFFCITKNYLLVFIRLYEKVNNKEMIYHN